MELRTNVTAGPQFSSTLLTASILLAQIDMTGLVDYAVKAGIGGAIWLGYKLAADYIDRKRKANK